jgi:beta-lactamase class A
MSIGALCQAIVEVSDNTAAILLMRSAGGPTALTQFVRSLGDTVTRSDRYEPESNKYSGVLDTTSPRAITRVVSRILLGDVLSPRSRAQLENWMIACKPGLNRLGKRPTVPERASKKKRTTTQLSGRRHVRRFWLPLISTRTALAWPPARPSCERLDLYL